MEIAEIFFFFFGSKSSLGGETGEVRRGQKLYYYSFFFVAPGAELSSCRFARRPGQGTSRVIASDADVSRGLEVAAIAAGRQTDLALGSLG